VTESLTGEPAASLEEELSAPCVLPPDAVAHFREHGYVRLPGVFSPALIERHLEIFTRLVQRGAARVRPMAERSTYEKAFLQLTNRWLKAEDARAFVFSPRLARIASELLEVSGVRLYHDQALFKEPGGGPTPWHADQFYWPLASDRAITAWVPLQPVPMSMGPLAFARGSHRVDFGRDLPISDESEAAMSRALADWPMDERAFEAGEVSFHGGWTFHRAGPNSTTTMRGAMTVIYMDASMRLAEPARLEQARDRAVWCPGVEVGEVVASPLNPMLWGAEND
jgi:ectoine hydroxylase-related dioxygenase (phytanoyl-CoA dioxygenase family)